MTQHKLQPYRKFELAFINQLIKQGSFYLVCQLYRRANDETDHTKTPVLFTPYKDLAEAAKHFETLKQRTDRFAALVDIRKEKANARLVEMCYGLTDKAPYIARVGNLEWVNRYLDLHYHEKMRSYVRKNRESWNIREPNSLQPFFEAVMGEPMVKIMWGKQFLVVSLEELESL